MKNTALEILQRLSLAVVILGVLLMLWLISQA